MTLKNVTLVTAIVNAVSLVVNFIGFCVYAARIFSGGSLWGILSNVSPWAMGLIADAALVAFLFVLYAKQERR
jgi:hypothetical protein